MSACEFDDLGMLQSHYTLIWMLRVFPGSDILTVLTYTMGIAAYVGHMMWESSQVNECFLLI